MTFHARRHATTGLVADAWRHLSGGRGSYRRTMTAKWSRIHAELGLAPSDLTFDAVSRAVQEGVREADDLDWKQGLPVDVEKKRKEFAKDVAAMANSRGGLIVYGVREVDERAVGLTPVPTGERERQRLRALATSHIRPLVAGLEITALDDGSPDEGLLIVSVPPSPDAPHVVGERNEMGVPFRHGPHTEWMSEHQLERAYRDRFARHAAEASAMTAMIDEAEQQLDQDKCTWLIVASRPLSFLPPSAERPTREEATEAAAAALPLAHQIDPQNSKRVHVLQELGSDAVNNPRVGLRRWVMRYNNFAEAGVPSDLIHIELHHNGATTIAIGISRWMQNESQLDGDFIRLPTRVLDSALIDALALSTTNLRSRNHSARAHITARLRPSLHGKPLAAVDNYLGPGLFADRMTIIPNSRMVTQVTPAEAEFSADATPEALRAVARQLSEDLLHQFAVARSSIST
ncbi:AlbA family DNA-binding domain-containing protein [Lentzea sp. HUAS TT2]|uniref:AlbA family DNA-binding domain-containing protein n=1 Tax=Lentzea sp. HUAS TT2 TaxID=3447454 RepID=UPI003F6F38E5